LLLIEISSNNIPNPARGSGGKTAACRIAGSKLIEAAMNRLSAFFKGRDTHLGLFYPEHYLLAVFPSLAQADRAQRKLVMGIPDEMAVATVGDRGGLRG
jgi:hypothetical protein